MADLKRKLRFYLQNNMNVLLEGRHGVGKTTVVQQLFEEEGINWMYFSASTMDPWVDFIGVPKEREDERGSYLDLVLPKRVRDDEVQAMFFDEFNRGKKKVRNAVLEFIQFRRINGREFKNLKVIWAAINPDDDEEQDYDVEKLDPAQKDRFHAQIIVPYKLDKAYFTQKYGAIKAKAAIEWWNALPAEAKNLTSPRRVDYALEIYGLNGNMRDALHSSTNVSKLVSALASGPVKDKLNTLYDKGSPKEIEAFFQDPNQYSSSLDLVVKSDNYIGKFVPHWPEEKISSVIATKTEVFKFVMNNYGTVGKFRTVLEDVVNANSNKTLVNKIKKSLNQNGALNIDNFINTVRAYSLQATHNRRNCYEYIQRYLKKAITNPRATSDQKSSALEASCSKLIEIAGSSHTSSIKSYYSGIFKMINFCISTMRQQGFRIDPRYKDDVKLLREKHSTMSGKINIVV